MPDSCNGTTATRRRITTAEMCSAGYDGPLCSVCQGSYYSWFQSCYKCPAPWRTALQIVGVVTLLTLVMLLLYCANKARQDTSETLVDRIAAKVKILVGFSQVMAGVFQALSYIPWPKLLLSFGHYMKLVELNVIAVATPSCISNSLRLNALKAPVFSVTCQSLVVIAIWSYYGIRYSLLQKCQKEHAHNLLSSARTSCLRNSWWIFFVSYPSTTTQIMAVLPYKPWTCIKLCMSTNPDNPFCKWFLREDMSLECNYSDPEWSTMWIICWSLSVYVVALPILLLIGLFYKKKVLDKSAPMQLEDELEDYALNDEIWRPSSFRNSLTESLNFLDENYKKKFWYWEVTEVFRKLVMTCGFQYFGQRSHSGVAMGSLLANLFLLLHAQLKPIKRKSDHWLQLLSLLVISLNLMIGSLLALSYERDDEEYDSSLDQKAFSVIVTALNALFLVFLVGKFVFAAIKAWIKVRHENGRFQLCRFFVFCVVSD
eukprot:m.293198 g.293198  ORF g.293198 m.293198 type:complete len:485 (+) comp40738_c0_seq10:2049-3503(+)